MLMAIAGLPRYFMFTKMIDLSHTKATTTPPPTTEWNRMANVVLTRYAVIGAYLLTSLPRTTSY
jgi:hypothetical protein